MISAKYFFKNGVGAEENDTHDIVCENNRIQYRVLRFSGAMTPFASSYVLFVPFQRCLSTGTALFLSFPGGCP